jgi:trk system potassium uptake protein
MYLIIVGAGPVGSSLVELTVKDGHNVVLVEADEERARQASEKYDARVLHANIADGGVLDEAGAEDADAIVATTSDDSANLMAMFLGKEAGIKNLVTVVNEARHRQMFERLGVRVLLDPEVIVARHLYYVVRQPSISEMVTLPGGAQVFEITIAEASPLVGKTLAQAGQEGLLREGLVIMLLKRDDETRIPSGKSVMQAGDELTVLAQDAVRERQIRIFNGPE